MEQDRNLLPEQSAQPIEPVQSQQTGPQSAGPKPPQPPSPPLGKPESLQSSSPLSGKESSQPPFAEPLSPPSGKQASGTMSASPAAEPAPAPLPCPLEEAKYIAGLLHKPFKAECIVLFGSLAGGTPHSDIAAYDLLVVSREEPYFGPDAPRRLLKLKFPPHHRKVGYINTLLYTQKFIDRNPSPVFYLAWKEGTVLYYDKHYRPKKPSSFNFDGIFCAASRYFATFFNLGCRLLDDANTVFAERNVRLAAFYSAQAAVLFLRTLFFVFYGFETDCGEPDVLYARLRSLSGELMLYFDGEYNNAANTVFRLRKYLTGARDDPGFDTAERTVEVDMDNVGTMREIVERVCQRRIALYNQRRK